MGDSFDDEDLQGWQQSLTDKDIRELRYVYFIGILSTIAGIAAYHTFF